MFTRATTYDIIDRTYHDGGARFDSVSFSLIEIYKFEHREMHGTLLLYGRVDSGASSAAAKASLGSERGDTTPGDARNRTRGRALLPITHCHEDDAAPR